MGDSFGSFLNSFKYDLVARVAPGFAFLCGLALLHRKESLELSAFVQSFLGNVGLLGAILLGTYAVGLVLTSAGTVIRTIYLLPVCPVWRRLLGDRLMGGESYLPPRLRQIACWVPLLRFSHIVHQVERTDTGSAVDLNRMAAEARLCENLVSSFLAISALEGTFFWLGPRHDLSVGLLILLLAVALHRDLMLIARVATVFSYPDNSAPGKPSLLPDAEPSASSARKRVKSN